MTSTLSNRLLLEVGFSTNVERLSQQLSAGDRGDCRTPFTAAWYQERHAFGLQRQRLGSRARRVDRHLPGSTSDLGSAVVRHRLALAQGAARSGRSARTATPRFAPAIWFRTTTTSPGKSCSEQIARRLRAEHGDGLQHADELLRVRELRPGYLRAGYLDVEAAVPQPGPSLRQVQRR